MCIIGGPVWVKEFRIIYCQSTSEDFVLEEMMDWTKILNSVIAAAILGIAGTFYAMNTRITRLETKFELLEARLGSSGSLETLSDIRENEENKNSDDNENIREIFTETFNENVLNWDVSQDSIANRYFSDGKYVIDALQDRKYIRSLTDLPELPGDYSIEARCLWKSGDPKRGFGIELFADKNNSYFFGLTKSGYAWVKFRKDGTWQQDIIHSKAGFEATNLKKISQKIAVRGAKFLYYVNNKFVGEGFINDIQTKGLVVFVEGRQVVEFDYLRVYEE